jgi:HAD superfamily hydrolase (TIGR01549 family)
MNLQWLFIDIGGPILDDGPLFDYLAAALRGILVAQGYTTGGQEFQAAMERGWREGASSTLDFIIRHFTPSDTAYRQAKKSYWEVFRGLTWDEYRNLQNLRSGVPEALKALASRYKLATLSNNVTRVRDLLEEYGVGHLFSAWGISEEVGFSKPDKRFFEHVLLQAGCRPEEAMMVGDRLDNDVLPARQLGLATALVELKHNFGAPPVHARGIDPDIRVESLWELAQQLLPKGTVILPEAPVSIPKSLS